MAKKRKMGKKLRKFSLETRLKSANAFTDRILKMFKGYIKAIVVWGSITRGDYTGKSDVDVYVIFDDTKMPLKKFDSIRGKVDNDISRISEEIDPRLHPQPVIALTEFWDGVRKSHPLFYNIVREGYALYDAGFFIPMRKLLEWGKFPATTEAAELRMSGVPKRIRRVQSVKLYMIAEDLYMAMLDAAQAVLMYVGVAPPVPKLAARELRKHLVAPGLLEEEYAKMMEDVVAFRKAVEHKELKEVSGKEVDEWIKKAEKYVKRFEELLLKLEMDKKSADIRKSYEVMVKASVAALKAMNRLPPEPEKLPGAFHKYLIESGIVNPMYGDVFQNVIKLRKLLEDKKVYEIPERDIYMNKEYVRRFVVDIRRIIEDKGIIEKIAKAEIERGKKAKKQLKAVEKFVETAKEIGELPARTKEEKLKKIEKKLRKEQKKHKRPKKSRSS